MPSDTHSRQQARQRADTLRLWLIVAGAGFGLLFVAGAVAMVLATRQGQRPAVAERGRTVDAVDVARAAAACDRLADLRGTLRLHFGVAVFAGDSTRRREPWLTPHPPVPLAVRLDATEPVGDGTYRFTVTARHPSTFWPTLSWADPPLAAWFAHRPAGVRVPAGQHSHFEATGRPGSTVELTPPASQKPAPFGVYAFAADGEIFSQTVQSLRLRFDADGWVTQTYTAVGRTDRPAGPPSAVAVNGVFPVEVPFHLRDVPVWAGSGAAE